MPNGVWCRYCEMRRGGLAERTFKDRRKLLARRRAEWMIRNVCERAGSTELVEEDPKLREIIEKRNTPALFDWLMVQISFQGISDRVAASYIEKNGAITWKQIEQNLSKRPTCPKLRSFWHFHHCNFVKSRSQCSERDHFASCPLPRHRLRNGRLNQSAYSAFLFIRDVAGNDLIDWIDRKIATSRPPETPAQRILSGLRGIYGVSDKLLTMALANLFLAVRDLRPEWNFAAYDFVVIDTLVHNWLHRTGVIVAHGKRHAFGPLCYAESGCLPAVKRLAAAVDATEFNREYPRYFVRFVQNAIWRFCALDHLNICNGNQIDDQKRCKSRYCILFRSCRRQKPAA